MFLKVEWMWSKKERAGSRARAVSVCVGKITWAVSIVREETSRALALRHPKVGGWEDEDNPQRKLRQNSQ